MKIYTYMYVCVCGVSGGIGVLLTSYLLELFNIKIFLPLSSVSCVIMHLCIVFTFCFGSQVEHWKGSVFAGSVLGASVWGVVKNTPRRCLCSRIVVELFLALSV